MRELPKIESDVPFEGGRSEHRPGYQARFREMKEGDSLFFVGKRDALLFCAAVKSNDTDPGFRARMRTVQGGWRVWKIAVESPNAGG